MATLSDPTGANLDALRRDVGNLAVEMINELRAQGYRIIITSALRTPAEEARLVQQGKSRTLRSYHLTGQAFDVDLYGVGRDQIPAAVWDAISTVALSYGFEWGGNWKSFVDKGHFQYT